MTRWSRRDTSDARAGRLKLRSETLHVSVRSCAIRQAIAIERGASCAAWRILIVGPPDRDEIAHTFQLTSTFSLLPAVDRRQRDFLWEFAAC
jgi:hypothetical protein